MAKLLARNVAEGLVLPGLHVAGRPVVDEAKAEDMLLCLCDGDGLAESIAGADENSNFKFVIERAAWAEARIAGD